jgi:hypothetical protein
MSTIEVGAGLVQNGLIMYVDAANDRSYTSGTSWNDLTGNLENGSLVNSPTFASLSNGNGYFTFDGIDEYVDFGVANPINGLSSVSFCAWVYLTSNSNSLFFTKYNSSITPRVQNYVGVIAGGSSPTMTSVFGSNDFTTWTSSTAVPLNQWNHFVYSVSNPGSSVTFYLNGQTISNSSANTGIGSGSSISAENSVSWLISRVTNISGVPVYYANSISSLYVYNRAITASEVLQNYTAGRYRFGV